MSFDIVLFSLVLLFLVVIGLPTIRQTVTLPVELETEEVSRGRLSKAMSEHFNALDREMIGLSFTPLLTFRVTNLGSDNTLRLYLHASSQTFALATCIGQDSPQGRVGQNYLEFIDEFTDATSLTSRNTDIGSVFAADPRKPVQGYPNATPDQLWAKHREACQCLNKDSRSWSDAAEILQQGRESHREMCRFQVRCGRLELDPTMGRFRATYRLAIFGIANFLNPFADSFSLPRFLVTLFLAGLVPLWGLSRLPEILSLLALSPKLTEFVSVCFHLFLFSVSGGVVGWSFPGKTFIWGFLATYLPLAVLSASGDAMVLYCIWASLISDRVSTWRLARRDLHTKP